MFGVPHSVGIPAACICALSSSIQKDSYHLAGIENAVGVKNRLDSAHEIDLALSCTFQQEGALGMPDAVFARHLASKLTRLRIQPLHHALHHIRPHRVLQSVLADVQVQVAVARMSV